MSEEFFVIWQAFFSSFASTVGVRSRDIERVENARRLQSARIYNDHNNDDDHYVAVYGTLERASSSLRKQIPRTRRAADV